MTKQVQVAIIGAGPAGLAAAMSLRDAGITDVVVLERETEAGGIPRHCGHPPFGITEFGRILTGPGYAARLRAAACDIDIRTRRTVTALSPGGELRLTTPDGSQTVHAERVLVATGIRETPRSAYMASGTRPMGICNTATLQQYVYLHGLVPFRRPIILGTELVSFSALLTCRRAGIRPVAMIEEGDRVMARPPAALLPRLVMGIPILLGTRIEEIEGADRVSAVRIGTPDGTTRRLECDGVLLTGKFTPENALVRSSHLTMDQATRGPEIDQFGRCSDPAFSSAGNILRAVETAGCCYREGLRAGRAIAASLRAGTAEPIIRIAVGHTPPVEFVVPQVVSLPLASPATPEFGLRVKQPWRGVLGLAVNGRELWSRNISALPERRVRIPPAAIGGEPVETIDIITA
jgi:thioredoxin reductase